MRAIKLGILTLVLLVMCAGYLFAGGFALSGIGSKAISLGGAFRGMADDGTAMYWNPAGLGFMDNSFITLAGAGIIPSSEFTNSNADLPGFTTEKVEADKKLWLFPNLYAVKACNECKLKFGLGAYVPYGLGATWDAFDLPTQMMTAQGLQDLTWPEGFPEKEMESSIGIFDIHPTVAYQFSEHFSAGAGLSVNYGMINIKKVQPHDVYSYYLPTTMKLDGTGLGFGGNIGFMYKVNDMAKMGISGKFPSSIKMDGDAEIYTWVNNIMAYGLEIPSNSYGGKTDATATLNLPGDIGWGLSLKLNPMWTLNTDFSYTFWSALDEVKLELDSLNILGQEVPDPIMYMKWKDAFRVSLGTEYAMGNLALRGGFYFDQSPIPYTTLSPTWPDTNDKYSGNVGFGYNFGKWLVDLNYEHIFFTEREIETETEDNMVGTYNTGVDAFNFGLTYNF
jgi:long-chain fatty acid transport protein